MQNETKWDKVEIEWLRGANIVYYSYNSNEWSTVARVNVVKEKQVQGLKCKPCEAKISQKHHSTAPSRDLRNISPPWFYSRGIHMPRSPNPSWISASSNTFWKVGICLRGEIFACASISFLAGICQKHPKAMYQILQNLPKTHDNFMFFRNQRVLSKKNVFQYFLRWSAIVPILYSVSPAQPVLPVLSEKAGATTSGVIWGPNVCHVQMSILKWEMRGFHGATVILTWSSSINYRKMERDNAGTKITCVSDWIGSEPQALQDVSTMKSPPLSDKAPLQETDLLQSSNLKEMAPENICLESHFTITIW